MMMTKAEVAQFLLERDHFCILTHRRPDGDTLGTAATLCRGLRQLGKTAYVLENPEITAKYKPLLDGLTKTAAGEDDTLVCVDVASGTMLPASYSHLAEDIHLRIDHHGTADSFTQRELVEPKTGACGEIVYGVLQLMQVSLDKEMAEALYTAVSTDTGCFRYGNTTANTLRVAADCVEAGADTARLNRELFDTNSYARLRIQGWITENTRFFRNGKLALCALPLKVEKQLGATEDDMENISGFPRSIEGVCMAATLRENPEGGVKISVRAIPGYDAAAICAKFGGGGHKGAAGASLSMPLEEAARMVEQAMLSCSAL